MNNIILIIFAIIGVITVLFGIISLFSGSSSARYRSKSRFEKMMENQNCYFID
jgi:hypothetical protein